MPEVAAPVRLARALPIRTLTPGATVAVPVDELCRLQMREPEPIPTSVRAAVLRAYGMEAAPDHEYELDFLITPALGGSPDPRNLWPEPYHSPVWNASVKDELEILLPRLVCAGQIDLETAQRDIAIDWIAAYKKYFKTDRPLRRG
ncbi:MAG: HNH endonuclease [Acidimicrobiia bacterium]|nr:HNH endonuclease [Acidimicrobiia bacterium]